MNSCLCSLLINFIQAVFHSTHRFFITPYALYVVLYDMNKMQTHERVKYALLLVLMYLQLLILL